MRSLLRAIRSKPKVVRNQYALGVAFMFTGVVALAWVMTGMSLDPKTVSEVAEAERPAFANLTEQIKEQWAAAQAALKDSPQGGTSTDATVVEDPLDLTLSEETRAELASSSPEWIATSSATTTEPSYIVVQIATSSSLASSTATTASTTR